MLSDTPNGEEGGRSDVDGGEVRCSGDGCGVAELKTGWGGPVLHQDPPDSRLAEYEGSFS